MPNRFGHQDRRGFDIYIKSSLVCIVLSLGLMILYSWKIGLLLFIISTLCFIVTEAVSAPPANGPRVFLKSFVQYQTSSYPVLVILGDSISHGNCSSSYAPDISRSLAQQLGLEPPSLTKIFVDPLWVVNAAQNGIDSYTVLKERIQPALKCHPDYILILLGTNDVRAMYNKTWNRRLVKTWSLPEPITLQTYENNLKSIIDTIQQHSIQTFIGVCTLPPLGEDLKSTANEYVRKANIIIEKTVNNCNEKCTIVPLYSKMEAILEKKPNKNNKWGSLSVDYYLPLNIIMTTLYTLLPGMISWNTLSKPFGNLLLSDGLHLNDTGRDVVVDTVVEWLLQNNIAKAIAVKRR